MVRIQPHLIAEMQGEADAVVEQLEKAAGDLITADAAWSDIRQRSADLLHAVPGANAAQDSPTGHALESLARDLRRANTRVVSPLPHFAGLEHRQKEEKVRGHRAPRLVRHEFNEGVQT